MNKLISHQVYICAYFVLKNLLVNIAKITIISNTVKQVVITFHEVFGIHLFRKCNIFANCYQSKFLLLLLLLISKFIFFRFLFLSIFWEYKMCQWHKLLLRAFHLHRTDVEKCQKIHFLQKQNFNFKVDRFT